jgi:signal transduction histidine kinase
MVDVESIKEARIKAKNRGVKFRYVTEVTPKNISYCKEMIKYFGAEIRHLDDVKGNFEISDDGTEYVAIANIQEAKPLKQLIYSNVKEIGEQQQYIFDTLWNKTLSFDEKIKEIEQGIIPEVTEVIRDSDKAQELEWNLLKMATKEIQIIYSTVKAYKMQQSVGVIDYLAKVATAASNNDDNIKVRILTPKDSSIKESLQNLKDNNNVNINYIEPKSGIIIKTLVVDKKHSLVMELKDKKEDYSTETAAAAIAEIGISTYSNSKPTVLSYLSIFETLWRQTELFEQLKQSDILKTEFINIAAHELRTPTQTILGYCEMIDLFPEKKDEYINPIKRNSERLYKLTQDILEVAKIESNSLKLDIEKLELNEVVNETVIDFIRRPLSISNNKDVKINFNPSNNNNNNNTTTNRSPLLFVYVDKNRIQQVIFNLLDNASKFTEQGEINISIIDGDDDHKNNNDKDNGKYNDDIITIRIQDTGKGIDPQIVPQLFKKFATKSERGTGLGLYISKNIIEAHGGKIWIEKTSDGKGAIFAFTLPTRRNNRKK